MSLDTARLIQHLKDREPLVKVDKRGDDEATAAREAAFVIDISEEVQRDMKWALQERERGGFKKYSGKHVAVLEEQVVGSGINATSLRRRLSKQHSVQPGRLIVEYVQEEGIF